MKNSRRKCFEFTFVNNFTLVRTPYVYVYADSVMQARKIVSKYFPESIWSLESYMTIDRPVVYVSQFRLVDPLIDG